MTIGLSWSIAISVIASSYTYLLWNHPYAIIIFTAEVIWIGFALKRNKTNIILIDSLYWLILGAPLVFTFYQGIQHLNFQSAALVALKQSINGIFNATVADIITTYMPLKRWVPNKRPRNHPTYTIIFFHIIAVSLMTPSLILLAYMNHRETTFEQKRSIETLETDAKEAATYVEMWVQQHVNAVQVIAELGDAYALAPSKELQVELRRIHKLFPDFHNIFLGNANAETIAFDPPVNERGETTIGINFSDREWFKQLNRMLKPVVSNVFIGRGGVFSAIFSISAPVVRDNKLAWFGLGAVNLERLREHITKFRHEGHLSIIDETGNIIVSSDKKREPLTPLRQEKNGTIVRLSEGVRLWKPETTKNVSRIATWKNAYYFMMLPVKGTHWKLMVEIPLLPTQKYLYGLTTWGLGGVGVLYALSMLLAYIISRQLSGTIGFLSKITQDLPSQIRQQSQIIWPRGKAAETTILINNFKDAESALRDYISKVNSVNEELEEKVSQRTQELADERERIGNILYGMNVGTWEWNVQTGATIFNSRWAEIIGYTLDELAPVDIRTWMKFVHPHDLTRSNQLLEKHFNGEIDYYECECRMRHKNGQWVWVIDRGKVVSRTPDNKPLTMSGTHIDITKRKKIENALKQAHKTESLTRMAGAIAHNFNNHLNVVIGNLELAAEESKSHPVIVHFLKEAREAAQRAAEVGTFMLTYLGHTFLKSEPVDLSEICRNNMTFLQELPGKHIIFETDLPDKGPVVSADSDQVCRILTHLIKNSVEAIGDLPGTIRLKISTIHADSLPKPHVVMIDWTAEENALYGCIEIADSGHGISKEDMDNLFDPFFTTRFTGRGLGLPVVLGIIRSLKGCISVESHTNKRTYFRVFIPRAKQAESLTAQASTDETDK